MKELTETVIVALTSWPAIVIALAIILRPKKQKDDLTISLAEQQQRQARWPDGMLGRF